MREVFILRSKLGKTFWITIALALVCVVGQLAIAAVMLGSLGMDIHWTGFHSNSTDDQNTLRFLIESSPNNLDLRQGTDAQSERIGALIYDALVRKDDAFNLQPWLATSWERPDVLTWVFHLRTDAKFHDGKPLTADDVAWSIRSMTGTTLVTAKGGAFAAIDSVTVRDAVTVVVHTRTPDAGLLFNRDRPRFLQRRKGHRSD